MGIVQIDLFTTLDGVAQAPGGPEEDPEGGFAFGGWQAPLSDGTVGEQVVAGMETMDALLLGRRTYDIFAEYWPRQQGHIADVLSSVPRYVASRHPLRLAWEGAEQLGPDLGDAVRGLRERHAETHVIGSLDLVQTLLADGLFDRLNLWVYPLLLGAGKRVFGTGTVPTNLRLAEPVVTTPGGVQLQRYERLDGTPAVGTMSAGDAEGR
ncbi:dihydrofolate reductase [Sanguibacter keddieii DSM 10542]|uniref:Dihydrofolate reductase n=1 Tax=Sanguibacter keddieii (strain ATCC 51767 / DSM 10542 / NCFB 3025 / ST-74) TaxID=446469 RepID=D1BHW2_SANKS|nr:dihydrofolate reductase family protein [Sanguibacter keddieii]ACZ22032.1 dihydrofolate reductase [Sanguibacter keddieii DSM 10542]